MRNDLFNQVAPNPPCRVQPPRPTLFAPVISPDPRRLPQDVDNPFGDTQRAIFGGIGRQFVNGQAQRQRIIGRQLNVRAVHLDMIVRASR